MAISPAPVRRRVRRSPLWTWLHSLVHLIGLAGVLAVAVGLVLAYARGMLPSRQLLDAVDACLQGQGQQAADHLHGAADAFTTAMSASPRDNVIGLVVVAGAAAVLLYLVIEALVVATLVAGRRSALGASAAVQIGLAAVVFLCVNVWSFRHPTRYDWTRSQQFTLPEDVVSRLQKLDPSAEGAGEAADRRTTVIVYQRHKTFGSLSDKPDRYDYAAERKVVEKVKDLAEELRRLGKQLRVEVLDVEAEDYKDRLTALTKDAPELQQAIEAAPENSLFFTARGSNGQLHVQRLSFNDFYLLDKKSSEEADGGKGNLVLLYQGMEPFARRILNLEERPPRVGIAVIHDLLSSQGHEDIGLTGLRTVLQTHGFEVRDVVLKKWTEMGPPAAAAATRDESRLAELDASQDVYEQNLRTLRKVLSSEETTLEVWQKAITDPKTRAELERRYADQLGDNKLTAELAEEEVELRRRRLERLKAEIVNQQQKLDRVVTEKKALNVPQLREQQRMTDVRAKMDRLLADCDVLLVPRPTLRNTANRNDFNLSASIYRLDAAQVEAIKDFLKAGKPVLACFGPSNEPQRGPTAPPPDEGPDLLEQMLADVGIRFGKQTILFFDEMDAYAKRRAGLEVPGATTIPAVRLEWARGEGRPAGSVAQSDRDNPLRDSLQLLGRSLGTDQGLDLHMRHPRPIYFVPPQKRRLAFEPTFLMSSENSWNEDQPFPTENSIPQFQRFDEGKDKADKAKDGKKEDPLEKRRRGPFPLGVAVEVQLPQKWYDSAAAKPATVRLAAIGQSWFFVGKDLSSAREEKSAGVLMVNTLNWLLGRDDYLPHAGQRWSYPRVDLPEDSETGKLWRWGVFGLPLLSAALGVLVWLMRRIH